MNRESAALVFPGQGSQKIGMGASFKDHAAAKDLFAEADDTLQINLTRLMLSGEQEELSRTCNTQPALLLAGVAALRVLEDTSERYAHELCRYMAGHSLGEYTALVAAGVLRFPDAISLVHLRGKAMQEAVPEGEGKMAAILGLEAPKVRDIAAEAQVFVANDNADGQVVLSGTAENIEAACAAARKAGAKRAVELPVSAPFHCPLMTPVADVMAKAFKDVTFNQSQVPVISNVTARPVTDAGDWPDLLTRQVTDTVQWRESMVFLADEGVREIAELGAGKVLTGLAKRCDKRLEATALETFEDIKTALTPNVD